MVLCSRVVVGYVVFEWLIQLMSKLASRNVFLMKIKFKLTDLKVCLTNE